MPEISSSICAQDGAAKLKAIYVRQTGKKYVILVFLVLLLTTLALFSISIGTASISVGDVVKAISNKVLPTQYEYANNLADTIVMKLRFPRVLLAVLTGISLAGAGAVMQGILHNPLVSPYTLGMSGAASLGAAIAIVLGKGVFGSIFDSMGPYFIAFNAFIFGFVTIFVIIGFARMKGGSPATLVLAGVALGYIFSAGVSALKYFSNNDALKDLVVWLMGGMWGATWQSVGLLVPIVTICMLILLSFSWDMNALAAGEAVASNLGVDIKRLQFICLTVVTLAASATVAFTGIIGFIGLIAPHISRMLIGSDNRFLIPCSCIMGALILLCADTVGRTIISPVEIPVGIVTGLLGGPYFLYMLLKKKQFS
ncbi:FecCD family ABC transporter permease [Sporomusa acidovorans]|uniref:Vitamin B12 import system permease protein BtuC n=1 Tax=Sporomusa acidovorans (strain ATCC 49682 / DSM 3132 / Mol) TaxID=1123286 RepID=A0ABZ3IXR6_SPOA4|nr:iron ABC transporter permease [Sporomusa acidovorans]OZC22201.1 hemin transport system permease protein HmuU [Sporomusa acidovorans DSM 3132]SDE81690.1 iron complex transport system permease protein [Sporomusa acidovorans]